jgi:hypothetical protein
MKSSTTYFLALILSFLGGCNFSGPKPQEGKQKADSLQQLATMEREKRLADSTVIAERRELAATAFGQLKFGMCRDTVTSLMKRMLVNGRSMVLGDYEYEFIPQFDEGGTLYKLVIQSSSASALQLESAIRSRVDNLTKIITSKYGNPLKSLAFPDDFALVEKPVYWTGRWQFDTKTIQIGVANLTVGSRYRAVCWVTDENPDSALRSKSKDEVNANFKKAIDNF